MHKRTSFSVWVWLFVSAVHIVYAQDPYYLRIDKTQGLPSNTVYDIYQDKRGFMWFATDEGLCRYDSKVFKTYPPPVLTSRSGTCIKEDPLGRIWYSNFDGVLFVLENGELKIGYQSEDIGTFSKYHIMGNWLIVPGHWCIDVVDINTLQRKKRIKMHEYIYTVGYADHFFYQDGNMNIFQLDTTLQLKKMGSPSLRMIAADSNRVICASKVNQQKELTCLYIYGKTVEIPFASPEYISNICTVYPDLWICTKNGCFVKEETKDSSFRHLFKGKYISQVLKDKDGNYWISTTNEGVLFIPSVNNRYFLTPESPGILTVVDNELLFAGKGNHLYGMDLYNFKTRQLFGNNNNHEVSTFLYDASNKVTLLISDQLYEIHNGVLKKHISLAIKDVQKVDHKYYAFAASGVCGFYVLNDVDRPSVWDSLYNAYPNLHPDPAYTYSNFLSHVRGKSIAFDSLKNCVYMACNKGLYKITPQGISDIKFDGQVILARKLIVYKSHLVVLQNNGNILIMQPGGDIIPQSLIYKDEKLVVTKLVRRNNFLFFITTGKGIYELDMDRPLESFQWLGEIPLNEDVGDIEIWKNTCLVTCSNGILMINRGGKTGNLKPTFTINEVKVNDRAVNLEKENKFSYKNNSIYINYSILAFNTSLGCPLYYRINKGNWKLTSPDSRELELNSLKSDEYTLEFKLENTDTPVISTLHFTIKKPIWQVHWFWIAVIVQLIIIAYMLYTARIKQLKNRNKLLLEKVELERNLNKSMLTSIKAQMNPHFFYNALNTIQSFIYENDRKNASVYLSKFSKLTRLILEMSEKEFIPLSEEIMALHLYLDIEKIRFNNKLEFTIAADPAINPELLKIPPMIIQPYVENSIKHGLLHKKKDCRLTIDFKKEGSVLKVIVDDNGIGRAKSTQLNMIKENKHQSFATGANQKRLEILNNDKKKQSVEYIDKMDELGNSTGTTVIIYLPLHY